MTDKEKKKELKAQFKAKERQALETSMPLSKTDLKALFEHLNELDAFCDHSLKDTIAFLKGRSLDSEKITPWLREHGGYCDCEVSANVQSVFGDIVGLK